MLFISPIFISPSPENEHLISTAGPSHPAVRNQALSIPAPLPPQGPGHPSCSYARTHSGVHTALPPSKALGFFSSVLLELEATSKIQNCS